jgi:hypothetical protein
MTIIKTSTQLKRAGIQTPATNLSEVAETKYLPTIITTAAQYRLLGIELDACNFGVKFWFTGHLSASSPSFWAFHFLPINIAVIQKNSLYQTGISG